MERRAQVKVPAVPDLADFRERMTAKLARIRARVRVRVDPDLSTFRDNLRSRLDGANATLGVRLEANEREITRLRRELAHIEPPITVPVRVDADRNSLFALRRNVSSLDGASGGAGRGLAALAGTAARLTAMASAIPAVAGLGAGLAAMAPAAAVAVPALLAVASAKAAVAIGMSGVSDALKGDAEAMAKLAPPAQEFVRQARALAPAWGKVKTTVQGNLFQGLGDAMTRTARSVLPVLRTELGATATTLNGMAKGVATTAKSLADKGTLGTALKGANAGLKGVSRLPAVIVQGLGQVGAAAAPAFAKLSSGADGALERLSQRMTRGFESGGMQQGIEKALGLARQLGSTLGNVGRTLGNVFAPAAQAGGGFLVVLSDVAATAAKITATPQAQATFAALFQTLAAIGHTVGGVLSAGLRAALPLVSTLVTSLAGPLQGALKVLGPALKSLVGSLGQALQPVVRGVTQALSLVLPIVARLAAQLARGLGPVLVLVGRLVGQIATVVLTTLRPILAQAPALLAPILGVVRQLAPILAQLAAQLLTALGPSLARVGAAIGQLAIAAGPLITVLGTVLVGVLRALLPVITAVIAIVGKVAGVLAALASRYITGILVPAVRGVVRLFQGPLRGAVSGARRILSGLGSAVGSVFGRIRSVVGTGVAAVVRFFRSMGSGAAGAVRSMGSSVASLAGGAMRSLGSRISSGVSAAVRTVRGLPGKARAGLGNLRGVLASAGRALLSGFVDGIKSKIGSVKSTLGGLTSRLKDWKGPPKKDAKILTPAGRLLIRGFIKGIDQSTAQLRARLQSITRLLPRHTKSGVVKYLKRETAELKKLVSDRDRIGRRLESAERKLAEARRKYADARNSIRDGILGAANITQGAAPGAKVTVKSITNRLKDQTKAARKFAQDLAKLKAKGLSGALLEQIASAGVEGGSAYASALRGASKSQIKELNRTQRRLEKYAGGAGKTVADALYGSGVHAAEGLVRGLKSKEKAIERQMLKIARSMEKAIKRALGIKSPSRVMARVGRWIPAGLARGIESGKPRVDGLMSRLVAVPSVGMAGAGSLIPAGATGRGSEHVPTQSARVHIENYHAGGMTPGQVARDLEWRMKARG
ncbi:hypothetical protein [Streptomyces sp. MNP-20]|uniref:phage tail protein n=1 Tax=Streptomyces sp. MNP-20 TaxID=2721165 RepID=UPI0015532DCB|nr:hypothetical protein [Streptomyces sp. MNP-20]